MVIYISPVGYDSTRVTRPVLSEGIKNGDEIILLCPAQNEDNERASQAIEDIERIVTQIQPDVIVTTHTIPLDNFQSAVLDCSTLLIDNSGEIVINFGGGPREIYLAMAMAALAHPDEISKSLQFNDLDGSVSEITIPRVTEPLPDSLHQTLEVIIQNESGISIPNLAEQLDKAKSTVSRHVRKLEDDEAAVSEMHGKTKVVKPTFSGKLRHRTTAE